MRSRILSLLFALPLLGLPLLLTDSGRGQDPIDLEPKTPRVDDGAVDGIEPLVRGPIHEAYAQPVDFRPEPGEPLPKPPPDPIPEIAPDLRPEGDNVHWIPGYWAWDPEAA